MSPDEFRALALDLPQAQEGGHMGKADFRVGGRIFATLGHPDMGWAMVKLTREEQELLVGEHVDSFRPVPGGWGLKGCTLVRLESIDPPVAAGALRMAWRAHLGRGGGAPRRRRSRPVPGG